ncbi:Arf-domain-containing protein [Pseudovirgaria hyperparasitica]|uniref:Arf-domain-containing protein n=1 Tax=Pseudovirgaria hyperparasitica TaxID=470096 RepID=A0A6A6WBN9_9PEZI|nr:Arf-domain-containing protein [Pseudovirgaria hyperparasitica]KAF2759380.1 Arf-domain-containing protein [Pseudovirgaria hyperparasitica]
MWFLEWSCPDINTKYRPLQIVLNGLSWLGLVEKDIKVLFLGLDNSGKTTLLHVLRTEQMAAKPHNAQSCESADLKYTTYTSPSGKRTRSIHARHINSPTHQLTNSPTHQLTNSQHTLTAAKTPQKLTISSTPITPYDFGGLMYKHTPQPWRTATHIHPINAVIFLVDAQDHERFRQAKAALDSALSLECLASTTTVPFLVLGNKIDAVDAVSEEQLRAELGLDRGGGASGAEGGRGGRDRPVGLFMCSVLRGQGRRKETPYTLLPVRTRGLI